MEYAYKLLNRDLTTRGGCQWAVGETKTASGEGDLLCSNGWLHGYEHAEIAHFLNPIHANFINPVLYRVRVEGICKRDGQLKAGWTEMTLVEPVNATPPTTEQRVRFALYCALSVCNNVHFRKWAVNWLSGYDRTALSAARAALSVLAAPWAEDESLSARAALASARAERAADASLSAARAALSVSAAEVDIQKAAIYALSDEIYPDFLGEVDRAEL